MTNYFDAGVDIDAGYRAVELIKPHVKETERPEVIGGIGNFGGAFDIGKYAQKMKNPILISGTDGVGTKLKIAQRMDIHNTIGIDCVAMCVNDIVCSGAEPLFFLDYIACGRIYPEKIEQIVSGIAEGCKQAGCSLIGGETAEMPGFYDGYKYDLAGYATGIVDKSKMIGQKGQKSGQVLVGIESSGVHSNGFSLIRRVFDIDKNKKILNKKFDELDCTLGEELLKPTKIYVKPVLSVLEKYKLFGIMHITGGGFFENIPRGINEKFGIEVDTSTFPIPPIFDILKCDGHMINYEMFNTFNMGIGMVLVCNGEDADGIIETIAKFDQKSYVIGKINNSSGVVIQ